MVNNFFWRLSNYSCTAYMYIIRLQYKLIYLRWFWNKIEEILFKSHKKFSIPKNRKSKMIVRRVTLTISFWY